MFPFNEERCNEFDFMPCVSVSVPKARYSKRKFAKFMSHIDVDCYGWVNWRKLHCILLHGSMGAWKISRLVWSFLFILVLEVHTFVCCMIMRHNFCLPLSRFMWPSVFLAVFQFIYTMHVWDFMWALRDLDWFEVCVCVCVWSIARCMLT